jgi:xylulokinase
VPLVLGVSFGPHATLVEVRDADDGTLVSTGRVHHAELGTDDTDPTAWWRSLTGAIARAGERRIAALSVSGSHPGLVLLDGAGVVLRPVQPWDGARAEVARLRQALGAARWARRTGGVPDAASVVTRLAWLGRTDPATYARIGAVLLPHDWLTFRMVGRPVTDRGSASCTGLWSPHSGAWITELLELLSTDGRADAWLERLPEVVEPDARADWLDAPAYELLGLQGRPLVAPGTAEPMALALALGLHRGRIGVALGEGTTVLAPLDQPIVDESGVVASRADATGHHLAVAGAAGGARLVDAMAELLDLHVADFGRVAMAAPSPPDELVFVPGADGRPGAVLAGLGASAGRDEVARATFEGVACSALSAVDAAVEAGARWFDHEPLHLTGPADALDVHAQVLATLAGRTVVATPGALAAAGACVQAAAVLREVQPAEVATEWDLGAGDAFDPEDDPDRDHRRALHAEEQDRQDRAWGGR